MPPTIAVYPPANVPTGDTGASGGTIDIPSGAISESVVNDFVPGLQIPIFGGGAAGPYYYANCVYNSGTVFTTPGFWLKNGLTKPASAGVFTLTPESAAETGAGRLHFLRSAVWDYEDIVISGLSPVTGVKTADVGTHVVFEKLAGAAGALTTCASNIHIACNGVDLGLCPAGRSLAGSIIKLSIDDTVNEAVEVANRLTSPVASGTPSPISTAFAFAFSYSSRLFIPGPANLGNAQFIKLWYEITIPDGIADLITTYYQPVLGWAGT